MFELMSEGDEVYYETDRHEFTMRIVDGQLNIEIRNKETGLYVFDKTFDETAENFV